MVNDLGTPRPHTSNELDRLHEIIKPLTQTLVHLGIPTPFLAIDGDKINENIRRWNKFLPHVAAFYAVKANTDPLVLQLLFQAGINADVASSFEMEICDALHLPPHRMILSNPRKDAETIRSLGHHPLWATTVDSEIELLKLAEQLIPNRGHKPLIFLRIKVPTNNVQQDLSSKFGIRVVAANATPENSASSELQLDDLKAVATKAKNLGFERLGLAFHVGTQCYQSQTYDSAVRLCLRIGKKLREWDFQIESINIGGGFADERVALQHSPQSPGETLDRFFADIGAATRPLVADHYSVIAEPGRYMVADSGTLVTQVAYDQSTQHTGRRIQIDDGLYRTLSGRVHDGRKFEFYPFRISPNPRPFLNYSSRFAIWGCSCDSFDKVAEDIILPADLRVGDYMMIPTMGAYSTSFGSNTNGFRPATTILFRRQDEKLRWQVSPLEQQNRVLIDHIRDWHTEFGCNTQ